MAVSLLIGTATAQTTAEEQEYVFQEQDLQPLEPTYLDNVFSANVWDNNWFLSVKGGMSAFTGKPIGHGDFFDRKKPLLNISAGKWFTPYVGGRFAYQGLKLIDSDIEPRSYQNVHADFLYNVAAHFKAAMMSYQNGTSFPMPVVVSSVTLTLITSRLPFPTVSSDATAWQTVCMSLQRLVLQLHGRTSTARVLPINSATICCRHLSVLTSPSVRLAGRRSLTRNRTSSRMTYSWITSER